MFNHAPDNYKCPICLAIEGIENEHTMARQADIVYRDDLVLVYVNSKFVGNNPGHVIVVPVKHFENLYELPANYAARIMEVAQKMALALKEVRKCDGVMIQQNNEPASGQHAFHYHMHVFPRFEGDDFAMQNASGNVRVADPLERIPYADALKAHLSKGE
jgi:histidine triad (HIT) family protein